MEHISKIDKMKYIISESGIFENGEFKRDDITLIWDMTNETRLIGFYYGGYDFDTTESYIKEYITSLDYDKGA